MNRAAMNMIVKFGLLALSLAGSVTLPAQAKADPVFGQAADRGFDLRFDRGFDGADTALDAALMASEACPQDVLDLTAETPIRMGVLLLSPCHAGETVVVDHAGFMIQTQLAGNGALYIALPSAEADAAVTVTYRDGTMQEAYLAPPAIEHIQDVAARW